MNSIEEINAQVMSAQPEAVNLFLAEMDGAGIMRHLIVLAKKGEWELLSKLLGLEPVRSNFAPVIENVFSAWYREHPLKVVAIVPFESLNDDETIRAFRYASDHKNDSLMLELAKSGLLPPAGVVQNRSERFDISPDVDYKLLVNELMKNPRFSWQTVFSFADYSGYPDVIERANSQDMPHLYVLGFALMTDKQKHAYIKSIDDVSKLHVIELSMIMPKKWIEDLPDPIKAELLSKKLGL